ncbi:MAG: hypothetical protein ABSG26_13790 [Bryobacteraceae bacterium]
MMETAGAGPRARGVSLFARPVGSPDEAHGKQEKKEDNYEGRPEEWNRRKTMQDQKVQGP